MLGDNLKWVRKDKKLSQKAFAEPLGTSSGYISEVEQGKKTPGADFLKSLSGAYRVSIEWLLTGEGAASLKEGEGAAVNMGLLGDTISAVEEWLERNQRKLPPEKKAEVVLYLYEEYLDKEEKPETATVERLLKLVA